MLAIESPGARVELVCGRVSLRLVILCWLGHFGLGRFGRRAHWLKAVEEVVCVEVDVQFLRVEVLLLATEGDRLALEQIAELVVRSTYFVHL